MRNRAEFHRAAKKRLALREAGRFSEPDGVGARVAVLMPFAAGLVRNERDSFLAFEEDADALVSNLRANEREPVLRMRATMADFEAMVADPTISSVIVRGFGNLSSIVTPKDRGEDAPVMPLDWLQLSKMSQHLKLGKFVMRTCGVTPRLFNPPLPYGVVASHRDILAPVGKVISVVGLEDPANDLIRPITQSDELTYEEIRTMFPLQRMRQVPGFIPDAVYYSARALHNMAVSDPRAASPDS